MTAVVPVMITAPINRVAAPRGLAYPVTVIEIVLVMAEAAIQVLVCGSPVCFRCPMAAPLREGSSSPISIFRLIKHDGLYRSSA
jgi:hypothetical protein